ncbi:putative phosphoglycerate mutase [Serratia fonticola]|jgi:broad specificity phosphatase PhoE|uniref:Putative phosphoglycerate mutase n=1 Tax=Serratia fonticola TaxID=47917 RepID=A0A559T3M0_SERFO|nr:histidine phosphatase family protein [Serratia fonticola]TQI78311.1 putative phosphoglycerate mutase [Serratia fonticola]TQI94691.1 putative phosphoglycerate mutase [Serratia fonticola]TVZ69190.1 putative phosphoglycerate mutase [Serratia fonticola]
MKIKIGLFVAALSLSSASVFNVSAAETDSINIYFARHGKTILNTYDRVQGWADSPLTPAGIETARYLGAGLKDIPFERYYTSDAGRQRETMQVILKEMGKSDVKVTELTDLREMFFGGFEGLPNADMANAAAKALGIASGAAMFQQMSEGKVSLIPMVEGITQSDDKKQAESALQVKTRMQHALNTMVQDAIKEGDKNILAVSSGLSMQMMISDMTDNPNKNKPLANAAVVKITYKDGKYKVTDVGDMSYVTKGKEVINKGQ